MNGKAVKREENRGALRLLRPTPRSFLARPDYSRTWNRLSLMWRLSYRPHPRPPGRVTFLLPGISPGLVVHANCVPVIIFRQTRLPRCKELGSFLFVLEPLFFGSRFYRGSMLSWSYFVYVTSGLSSAAVFVLFPDNSTPRPFESHELMDGYFRFKVPLFSITP